MRRWLSIIMNCRSFKWLVSIFSSIKLRELVCIRTRFIPIKYRIVWRDDSITILKKLFFFSLTIRSITLSYRILIRILFWRSILWWWFMIGAAWRIVLVIYLVYKESRVLTSIRIVKAYLLRELGNSLSKFTKIIINLLFLINWEIFLDEV